MWKCRLLKRASKNLTDLHRWASRVGIVHINLRPKQMAAFELRVVTFASPRDGATQPSAIRFHNNKGRAVHPLNVDVLGFRARVHIVV